LLSSDAIASDSVSVEMYIEDFYKKFKLFLEHNKASENEGKFNSFFCYEYGSDLEVILNNNEWVRNIDSAVSNLTFLHFKSKIDKFNAQNGANMQHLVILIKYPEFWETTTKLPEMKDATSVKEFYKTVAPGKDTKVYTDFLKQIDDAVSLAINDPLFNKTNKMVTYWGFYNKGDKKKGREFWARNYHYQGQ